VKKGISPLDAAAVLERIDIVRRESLKRTEDDIDILQCRDRGAGNPHRRPACELEEGHRKSEEGFGIMKSNPTRRLAAGVYGDCYETVRGPILIVGVTSGLPTIRPLRGR